MLPALPKAQISHLIKTHQLSNPKGTSLERGGVPAALQQQRKQCLKASDGAWGFMEEENPPQEAAGQQNSLDNSVLLNPKLLSLMVCIPMPSSHFCEIWLAQSSIYDSVLTYLPNSPNLMAKLWAAKLWLPSLTIHFIKKLQLQAGQENHCKAGQVTHEFPFSMEAPCQYVICALEKWNPGPLAP